MLLIRADSAKQPDVPYPPGKFFLANRRKLATFHNLTLRILYRQANRPEYRLGSSPVVACHHGDRHTGIPHVMDCLFHSLPYRIRYSNEAQKCFIVEKRNHAQSLTPPVRNFFHPSVPFFFRKYTHLQDRLRRSLHPYAFLSRHAHVFFDTVKWHLTKPL